MRSCIDVDLRHHRVLDSGRDSHNPATRATQFPSRGVGPFHQLRDPSIVPLMSIAAAWRRERLPLFQERGRRHCGSEKSSGLVGSGLVGGCSRCDGRIYGVSGDSLNGITDSIRKGKQIQWIHVRQEERARRASKLVGPLARSAGLRLALGLEIERHCGADEIFQGRIIDLVAFVDVDGAPDIPVEAGVK